MIYTTIFCPMPQVSICPMPRELLANSDIQNRSKKTWKTLEIALNSNCQRFALNMLHTCITLSVIFFHYCFDIFFLFSATICPAILWILECFVGLSL